MRRSCAQASSYWPSWGGLPPFEAILLEVCRGLVEEMMEEPTAQVEDEVSKMDSSVMISI